MKKLIFGLLLLVVFLFLNLPDCNAQRRNRNSKQPVVESLINKGDSCAEVGAYQQANNFYFQAVQKGNLGRSVKDTLNAKILSVKKNLHFESLMQNAKLLEDAQMLSGAKKFYEDAYTYARDEKLELTDSMFDRLQTIHQLIEIYNLLEQSQAAEAQDNFQLTQDLFLDAVEKADLLKADVQAQDFSPAIQAKLDSMMRFMVFKNDTILNYKECYPQHYDAVYQDIWDDLTEYLHAVHTMPTYAIRFISNIDSSGITQTVLSSDNIYEGAIIKDSLVLKNLQSIAQSIHLKQPRMHGFPMSAIAEFYVEFGEREYFVNVNKKQDTYKMKVATRIKNLHGTRFKKELDEEKLLEIGDFMDTETLEKIVKSLMRNLPDGNYKSRISCIKRGSTEMWEFHVLNYKKH